MKTIVSVSNFSLDSCKFSSFMEIDTSLSDTTAAGDTFNGALVTGLLQEMPLES
ncbi:PfkB family carbohydrate kinase, partial [Vibrio cholerae]